LNDILLLLIESHLFNFISDESTSLIDIALIDNVDEIAAHQIEGQTALEFINHMSVLVHPFF